MTGQSETPLPVSLFSLSPVYKSRQLVTSLGEAAWEGEEEQGLSLSFIISFLETRNSGAFDKDFLSW